MRKLKPPPLLALKSFFADLHWSQEWSWMLKKNLKSDNYLKIFIPGHWWPRSLSSDIFLISWGRGHKWPATRLMRVSNWTCPRLTCFPRIFQFPWTPSRFLARKRETFHSSCSPRQFISIYFPVLNACIRYVQEWINNLMLVSSIIPCKAMLSCKAFALQNIVVIQTKQLGVSWYNLQGLPDF